MPAHIAIFNIKAEGYRTKLWNACIYYIYIIYIQGDHKVSVHLIITIQKVTSNVQSAPASLQTLIGTRLTLTPSVIPNSNYVIMVSD
jgi:hypothetical protein